LLDDGSSSSCLSSAAIHVRRLAPVIASNVNRGMCGLRRLFQLRWRPGDLANPPVAGLAPTPAEIFHWVAGSGRFNGGYHLRPVARARMGFSTNFSVATVRWLCPSHLVVSPAR